MPPPEHVMKAMQETVNFVEQDSDALFQIFNDKKKALQEAISDEHMSTIHHIGSTSIRGMPGPPVVDMILFVKEWPPCQPVLTALDQLKFQPMGDAPHFAQDLWYMYLKEGSGFQDIGNVVLHVIHKDNSEAYSKQILWSEYCNNNKEAFEAYKAIKVAAKETGNFGAYKMQKSQMMQKLFPKAEEWKAKQMAEQDS